MDSQWSSSPGLNALALVIPFQWVWVELDLVTHLMDRLRKKWQHIIWRSCHNRWAFGSFTLREVTCHAKQHSGKAHVVRNHASCGRHVKGFRSQPFSPVKSSETTAPADNFWRDLLRESESESLSKAHLSSVQFSSVMSDSLRPYGLQHARPPCTSLTLGVF